MKWMLIQNPGPDWSGPVLLPVFPGGRSHCQITQNRPYKKIFCGGKLEAAKVAVSGHVVLWSKFRCKNWTCQTFHHKKDTVCKKCHNISPQQYILLMFSLKACTAANFLMGGRERSQNGGVFWWMWPWRLVRTWQHCLLQAFSITVGVT